MSRMNTMIPLGIEAPDFIGAMNRGAVAGQQRNDIDQTNALRNFMAQSGGDVFAGDQNALRQYAQFDPNAAYDMQAAQADAARRDQLFQMEQQRFDMDRQQFEASQAPDPDAFMSEAVNGLNYYFSQGDADGYYAQLDALNIDREDMPIDAFPMVAAQFGVQVEAPEQQGNGFDPDRYRNVDGIGLVDLYAEGGPAPVQFDNAPAQQGADPTDLRKEWNSLPAVRQFAAQAETFGRVASAAQDPSPVGDLALIYNFMKSLDPSSTVMAGEYANAQNTGSIDQTVAALYNKVVSGERLTAEQRADFLNRSARMYQSAEQQYGRIRSQYEVAAQQSGVDPEALTDFRYRPQGQVPYVTERPQARPVIAPPVQNAPSAPPAPGQSDFSQMTMPDLLSFDLNNATIEEINAWNKRLQELGQ